MSKSLKERRTQLGLTLDQVAAVARTSRQQIHKLESGTIQLSQKWAKAIAPALGTSWPELMGWEGISLGEADLKARQEQISVPAGVDHHEDIAGVIEIDVLAGAGQGGEVLAEAFTLADGGGVISADSLRETWGLPDLYLRGELGITKRRARIVEVRGDSMEPTLKSGDRVMVDIADRVPSPAGLFVLWDGWGVAAKRLEIVPDADPPAVRILSDNVMHSPVERTWEEINIIGRVVWLGRRM